MRSVRNALFKSLSDPTRRALFERLSRDGELTVRMLTLRAGVSQPAVSKHLRILKRAGLVQARRHGRETHYSARPRALGPLVDWMNYYNQFWQERFDRLENLLERMEK
jgi:DNA-binding transcriptional ArsR family regulator